MEISLVTFPMNEQAMVQSVKGNSKVFVTGRKSCEAEVFHE